MPTTGNTGPTEGNTGLTEGYTGLTEGEAMPTTGNMGTPPPHTDAAAVGLSPPLSSKAVPLRRRPWR